ncbi:MAG: hypothetical protein ACFFD2_14485 [Promethearchaeota archaeon]
MKSLIDNFESSKYAKILKDECVARIPLKKGKEILILIYFLIIFTIITIYLWINTFIYNSWFYIMLGIVLIIVVIDYLMNRYYSPNWRYYFLEILNEMKRVDTIKLSDFINEGQPFFGASLGNCEKFLSIAKKFIKDKIIDITIKGSWVYVKGYEPPPEEDFEEEKKENNHD